MFAAGFNLFAGGAKPRRSNPSKGVPKPTPTPAAKAGRVTALFLYITSPTAERSKDLGLETSTVEKCIHWNTSGFVISRPGDVTSHIREMRDLATVATRGADPIEHFVFSWRSGETPTAEQADDAARIALKSLGMRHHQAAWALHANTDCYHIHLIVNRVDPITERVRKINAGFTKEAAQQAAAKIAHAQGWSRHAKQRYRVDELGRAVKVGEQKSKPSISRRAHRSEATTGIMSAQRQAQRAAPEFSCVKDWAGLHAAFHDAGLMYVRKGSGAIVIVGDRHIKASDVDRSFSLSKFEKRFGPYQPEEQANGRIAVTDPNRNASARLPRSVRSSALEAPAEPESIDGRVLLNVFERDLSKTAERRNPGVLPVDVEAGQPGAIVRRPSVSRRRGGSGERALIDLEPLGLTDAWDEYIVELRAARSADLRDRARRECEISDLKKVQRKERDEVMVAIDWTGRGAARNALAAALATRHRLAMKNLKKKHGDERKARNKVGDFGPWLVGRKRERDAVAYHRALAREKGQMTESTIKAQGARPTVPETLADFHAAQPSPEQLKKTEATGAANVVRVVHVQTKRLVSRPIASKNGRGGMGE